MSRRALVLGGGSHGHAFEATTAALVRVLEAHDLSCVVVTEPDNAWRALSDTPFDLFAVNALRFRMEAPKYDQLRDEWRYDTPPMADDALDRHLDAGRPILAMHTSCICFDDWDRWSDVLGRQWSWASDAMSWHPDLGPIEVKPANGDPFTITDERYTDLINRTDIETMATCDGESIIWRLMHGKSRVAVDTLGHSVTSYRNEAHAALLHDLVTWVLAQ
jgi:hypothetical protein